MRRPEPLVHVLINNWNGWEDTVACLDSLYAIEYRRFVVILVDNGSEDGTPEKTEEWCKQNGVAVTRIPYQKGTPYADFATRHYAVATADRSLALIACDSSIGFTGANNLSIEIALRAGTDYVLFLNNDTEVAPDFLTKLVQAAEEHPPAVWGSKIRFYEPADEIWFAGGYVNIWGVAVSDSEGERDIPGRFTGVGPTELVSGCVMLLPRTVLEEVGGQDDRYFFAVDDIEYSTRIRKAGFPRMMALDAVVRHKVTKSLRKKRPLQLYYLTRNTLMWRFDHYGLLKNALFLVRFFPRWLAELVARALYGQSEVSKGMWQGLKDYLSRTYGECPHEWLNPMFRAPR